MATAIILCRASRRLRVVDGSGCLWPVALTCAALTPASANEASSYQVGADGWVYERFGSDVAIFRTSRLTGFSAEAAGLLLSCSGSERRIRMSFSTAGSRGPFVKTVRPAMIRPFGSSAYEGIVVSASMPDALTVVMSETAYKSRDIVLTIGHMFLLKPASFDLVLPRAPGPPILTRLVTYRLNLTFRSSDTIAIGRFLSACTRAASEAVE